MYYLEKSNIAIYKYFSILKSQKILKLFGFRIFLPDEGCYRYMSTTTFDRYVLLTLENALAQYNPVHLN
jgi:hypothetical protein